jgi:hypothetical protein
MHQPLSFLTQHKKWLSLLSLLVVMIPTYYIHTTNYPDWGDDFAQYVYQAQQINSPSETYIQVLNVNEYSSPKKSVFFSVVLSVIHPSICIQQYVNLTSVFYIIAALCFFVFLTAYFSSTISFIATLLVFYNFLFLRLKSEVVPEFLFIALFYSILYLIFKSKINSKYSIPILLSLLVSVRFIGLSLLLSYLFFLLIQKNKTLKQRCVDAFLALLVFAIGIAFINYFFLSSINNQEVKLYGSFIINGSTPSVFCNNMAVYAQYLLLFFEQEIPFWINIFIKFLASIFFIIGLVHSLRSKNWLLNSALVFYFLFLFLYPYHGDTIKYLIPIFPLIIYYLIVGITKCLESISIKNNKKIIALFLTTILLSNSKTIWLASKQVEKNIGPFNIEVLNDFKTITKIVNPNQSIAFAKPFIINLLCNRPSYFISEKNHQSILKKADYFLSPKNTVHELCLRNKKITLQKGDTISLVHFYLIKL